MAECMFVTATLFLTLTFIASGIAFFAPFWVTLGLRTQLENRYMLSHQGLWGGCPGGECTWFWTRDFEWGEHLPDWHIAVMVLYGVGFLVVFVTEIYSRLQLCCEIRSSMSRSAGFLLIAAFVLMAVGLGVYGGMANKDWKVKLDMGETNYFDWGFWMGVAGCGLSLVTGLMFIFVARCRCGEKM